MRERRYHRKQNKKSIFLGGLLAAVILALLIIFGLFRVKDIAVTGNSIYTSTDIKNAVMQDGLCKNTLYLMWKYKDGTAVAKEIPFLSSAEFKMESPFKVSMKVYEKPEIGYVLNGTDYIYFDRDGLIVEISKKLREHVPEIQGVVLSKPERYAKLPIKEENICDSVIQIAQLLSKNGIVPKTIKYNEAQEITLYFPNVRVKLGQAAELEGKIAALKAVYEKVDTMQGVLHMETYSDDAQTITFRQGETEETLEMEETEEETGDESSQSSAAEGESETNSTDEATAGPTYSESDGTFSTDAQGNQIYTDAAGNTTPNVDGYQYTDENGQIITDGYGYIDPYTGAYILGH